MGGSPLLRALLAAAVLLALALPLWRMTHRRSTAPPPTAPRTETAAAALSFTVEFTHPAREIRIAHLDRELCAIDNPPMRLEQRLQIAWPPEGVELRVQVAWPEGASPAAARIAFIAPDGGKHERSVWGPGLADEILTLP